MYNINSPVNKVASFLEKKKKYKTNNNNKKAPPHIFLEKVSILVTEPCSTC